MKRQDITLGSINYIIDLYDAYEDMSSSPHYEKFYMIRNGHLENGIFETTDILFIQQSLINDSSDVEISNAVVFPITGNDAKMSYSRRFSDFSQFFTEKTFKPGNNLERIYDNDLSSEADILCDKIRIWIPTIKPSLTAIVDAEIFVNDIRVHLLCKRSDSFEIDSNNEFTYDHNTYSEYFDMYVPNPSNLFSKNNYYFKEVFNLTNFKKRNVLTFVSTSAEKNAKDITKKSIKNKQLLENEILTINQEYFIDEDEIRCRITAIGNNARTLKKYTVKIGNGQYEVAEQDTMISNVMNIDNIEDLNGKTIDIYDEDELLIYSIVPDIHEIKISGEEPFSSMHTIVLPSFIEDASVSTQLIENGKQTIIKAYSKTFYDDSSNSRLSSPIKVIMYPYSNASENTYLLSEDANLNLDTFSKDSHIVMCNSYEFVKDLEYTQDIKGALVIHAGYEFSNEYETLNEAYLDMVNEAYESYIAEDLEFEFDEDIVPEAIDICGYSIEIATDMNFKSIVYSDAVSIDIPNDEHIVIDDLHYVISMNNIDVNWNSYPDFLAVRVRYLDKFTATVIEGNLLMISKEEFKYMINENYGRRLSIKNDNNDNMYFIDKINCTIVRKDESEEKTIQSGKGSSRILYKPIFYKAKDLDQIKIKSGLTQNIGLNLSSLLSKVDTFKIQINGKEYVEIGRNDQYVIFKINALELSDSTGQYNLLNQNDEYISDGTWYIY